MLKRQFSSTATNKLQIATTTDGCQQQLLRFVGADRGSEPVFALRRHLVVLLRNRDQPVPSVMSLTGVEHLLMLLGRNELLHPLLLLLWLLVGSLMRVHCSRIVYYSGTLHGMGDLVCLVRLTGRLRRWNHQPYRLTSGHENFVLSHCSLAASSCSLISNWHSLSDIGSSRHNVAGCLRNIDNIYLLVRRSHKLTARSWNSGCVPCRHVNSVVLLAGI